MAGLMGIIKAIFGICDTKPLNPELWNLEENRAKVKLDQMPKQLQDGEAIFLQGKGLKKPVFILKVSTDKYLAFTNSCTHAGRKLDPVPGEPLLRCCSVNHSTFDYDGNKINGPAKDPLTRHEVELSETELIITL